VSDHLPADNRALARPQGKSLIREFLQAEPGRSIVGEPMNFVDSQLPGNSDFGLGRCANARTCQ
jgi:hypothetical protein